MKRLTEEDIKLILELRAKGLTFTTIAKEIGFSISSVRYWANAETRNLKIKYQMEKFKRKGITERREYYALQRDYQRKYHRERYQNDEEFKLRKIAAVKKSFKNKKSRHSNS